jgi:hypothetical protein
VSEETPDKEPPKVFSLSGDPYQPPEELMEKPCEKTLTCIKDILDHVQGNQIRGVYVLGWSPKHQRFVRWAMMPSEEDESAAALRFLGGLEVAKTDLLSMVLERTVIVDDDGNPVA